MNEHNHFDYVPQVLFQHLAALLVQSGKAFDHSLVLLEVVS